MLPHKNYKNSIKLNHSLPQTLTVRNGYRVASAPVHKVGQSPLDDDSVAFVRSDRKSAMLDPVLTYGRVKHPTVQPFRPDFVQNDKIILTFDGFFRQTVYEPYNQYDRIRNVKVMYFMEDDTIMVVEPPVMNCGYPQGKIVRRSRILKDSTQREYYSWKDLNIGIDLNFFGVTYHLYDCNKFTREFLEANGIELNEINVKKPVEPYKTKERPATTSAIRKPVRQASQIRSHAISNDGIILCFECILIEGRKNLCDCLTYKLYYFLNDNTIAVKELKENSEGRHYIPMLLKRTRVPKHAQQIVNNILTLDQTDSDDFLRPEDLMIGKEIDVLGRRFLLYDCDANTRMYYKEILKVSQGERVNIATIKPRKVKLEVPEYLGFGTPEDSLASHLNLRPKAPRRDMTRYLLNANKYLRFGCMLDSVRPEDSHRRFILKFSLADGKIGITELTIDNSGISGGKFLSPQLVAKPGGNPNVPDYYSYKDLSIGAILIINRHRFKITSADMYDYNYMREHPELFSVEAINGVYNYLVENSLIPVNENNCAPVDGKDVAEHLKQLSFNDAETLIHND